MNEFKSSRTNLIKSTYPRVLHNPVGLSVVNSPTDDLDCVTTEKRSSVVLVDSRLVRHKVLVDGESTFSWKSERTSIRDKKRNQVTRKNTNIFQQVYERKTNRKQKHTQSGLVRSTWFHFGCLQHAWRRRFHRCACKKLTCSTWRPNHRCKNWGMQGRVRHRRRKASSYQQQFLLNQQ